MYTKASKQELVNGILGNAAYMQESEMIEPLRRDLSKLSLNSLRSLKQIIEVKVADARCSKCESLLRSLKQIIEVKVADARCSKCESLAGV